MGREGDGDARRPSTPRRASPDVDRIPAPLFAGNGAARSQTHAIQDLSLGVAARNAVESDELSHSVLATARRARAGRLRLSALRVHGWRLQSRRLIRPKNVFRG